MVVGSCAAVFALAASGTAALRQRHRSRAPHDSSVGKVITLGDSFASGAGIHTYGEEYDEQYGGFIDPYEFTTPDYECWREWDTTPGARYAASRGMQSVMMACMGAEHTYVGNQWSYVSDQHRADAASGWNNSVVLLTAGGNDLRTVRGENWPDLLVRCVTERYCNKNPENEVVNWQFVEDKLAELFSRLAQEAWAARIRVMGYPRLFQRYGTGCWNIIYILREETDWGDAMVDRLDACMAAAVRRAKAAHPQVDIEYVSVLDYITKGACADSDERMVNKEVITWSGVSDASFHPTQLGYDQLYRALTDSLSV